MRKMPKLQSAARKECAPYPLNLAAPPFAGASCYEAIPPIPTRPSREPRLHAGASPESRRSTSDSRSEVLRRDSQGIPGRLPSYSGEARGRILSGPPPPPSPRPSPPRRGRGRIVRNTRAYPLSPAEGERAGVRGRITGRVELRPYAQNSLIHTDLRVNQAPFGSVSGF